MKALSVATCWANALLARARSFGRNGRLRLVGPITHFATDEPIVALTFDDGPHPEYTPRLLKIMRRYEAKGTFFMVGQTAAQHRDIVEMVANDGHAIGNHSWDHPMFPDIPSRTRRNQIRACSRALRPHEAQLFRPPFGGENLLSHLDARLLGFRVVKWSIGIPDWEGETAKSLAERTISQMKPGSIVLMHDSLYGYSRPCREPTLEAVERILRELNDSFKFRSLPQMFLAGVPKTTFGSVGRT